VGMILHAEKTAFKLNVLCFVRTTNVGNVVIKNKTILLGDALEQNGYYETVDLKERNTILVYNEIIVVYINDMIFSCGSKKIYKGVYSDIKVRFLAKPVRHIGIESCPDMIMDLIGYLLDVPDYPGKK
jgi:hypothetical protein